jgi:hypothetical protein
VAVVVELYRLQVWAEALAAVAEAIALQEGQVQQVKEILEDLEVTLLAVEAAEAHHQDRMRLRFQVVEMAVLDKPCLLGQLLLQLELATFMQVVVVVVCHSLLAVSQETVAAAVEVLEQVMAVAQEAEPLILVLVVVADAELPPPTF